MFDGILHETHFKILQPAPPLPYCMCVAAICTWIVNRSGERRTLGVGERRRKVEKCEPFAISHWKEIPFGGAASYLTGKLAVTLVKNFRVHRVFFHSMENMRTTMMNCEMVSMLIFKFTNVLIKWNDVYTVRIMKTQYSQAHGTCIRFPFLCQCIRLMFRRHLTPPEHCFAREKNVCTFDFLYKI